MVIIPDFSHYQKDNMLAKEYLKTTETPYIIVKLTEGVSYVDEHAQTMVDSLITHTAHMYDEFIDDGGVFVTIGLYHFCRLNNKAGMETAEERAEKEALWFISQIEKLATHCKRMFPKVRTEFVPILDWEMENISQPNRDKYLTKFVGLLYGAFGSAPVIYCSGAVTGAKEMIAVKQQFPDVPLWVAHYNVNAPIFKTWKSYIAWQFTSKPFDLSFVDIHAFRAYSIHRLR